MAKVVLKLFRDPEVVSLAVKELKEESLDKGLSVIAREDVKLHAPVKGAKDLALKLDGKNIVAHGHLLSSLQAEGTGNKVEEAIRSSLGLSEESYEYYISAVGAGAILLSVEAEGEEARKVWNILRQAESSKPAAAGSATFYQASRMAATNAKDAAMSGDFRKY